MIWYGCFVCKNLDRLSGDKCDFLSGEMEPIPIAIASGQFHHTKPWTDQATDKVFEIASEFYEIELVLTNKDRFPQALFLEQKDFESVGYSEEGALILVGWESPDKKSPLVINWDSPYLKGDLLSFVSDYEGLEEEGMRSYFEQAQQDIDAMADRLEFEVITFSSFDKENINLGPFNPVSR